MQPNAAYVHYQSHALNLCIVHGCDDGIVEDVMSKVQEMKAVRLFSNVYQIQLFTLNHLEIRFSSPPPPPSRARFYDFIAFLAISETQFFKISRGCMSHFR